LAFQANGDRGHEQVGVPRAMDRRAVPASAPSAPRTRCKRGGIGKIDAKTGKLSFYPTPTPYARARRGRVDAQNRLWFAEFGGNAIGMFDPETEKITEYRNPLQWEAPYDVVADRNGEAWEVNETSDRVGRLDPRTAEITNYLLPRNGNIRRVFVDDRSNPVTIWIGNNLAASIVKIEPLD
jgi:streptogramin lyase